GHACHGENIIAVDLVSLYPETAGSLGDVASGQFGGWSPLCVSVVLAHEHDWQRPDLRKVHRLEQNSLIRCAVAEERDAQFVVFESGIRPCRSNGARNAAADDPVGTEHSNLERYEVHGATASAAVP